MVFLSFILFLRKLSRLVVRTLRRLNRKQRKKGNLFVDLSAEKEKLLAEKQQLEELNQLLHQQHNKNMLEKNIELKR